MKKTILIYAGIFIIVFLASAVLTMNLTGSAPQKLLRTNYQGTSHRDLPYKNSSEHKYDLYIPADADTNVPQNLILFIHGGSFNSGKKEDGDAWCKFYASHGYITATLDYTLQGQGTKADLHLMNQEVESCVHAIHEYCRSLGYPLKGMAVCGVSAGGTLAMNYAYKCAETSEVPVKFVFQLAGPADFEPNDWDILIRVNKWADKKEFVKQMTGQTFTDEQMANGEHKPYIDAISPSRLVNENSVPTLCGYGLKDHLVPHSSREELTKALDENGVPHDYLPFPNSNHGMYADPDVMQEFIDMSLQYCERYFS